VKGNKRNERNKREWMEVIFMKSITKKNKKAIVSGRAALLILAMLTLAVLAGVFIYNIMAKKAPGAVQQVGFSKFEDYDKDGIKNFVDKCCSAGCQERPVDTNMGSQFYGCGAHEYHTACIPPAAPCNKRPKELVKKNT